MDTKAIFLSALLSAGIAYAQSSDSANLRGAGSWKTDGETERPVQQWSLDLKRGQDGTVSGTIDVAGSPLVGSGRVEGKFDGRVIAGAIVDSQGGHVARFNGLLTPTGFRGKYVDRTGESGEWQWEGQLPEP